MWKKSQFATVLIACIGIFAGSSGTEAAGIKAGGMVPAGTESKGADTAEADTAGLDAAAKGEYRRSPEWMDLKPAQEKAADQGKKIMIFVEAEWCGICRRLEREVFKDADVLQKLRSSFISVMIDVDSKSPLWFNGQELTVRQFAQQHNVSAVPTLLFVDEEGEIMAHKTGFVPAGRLAALLAFIDSDSFGRQSLEEYLNEM